MRKLLLALFLLLPLAVSADQTSSRVVTTGMLPRDTGGLANPGESGGWTMPTGTTQQRPLAPSEGEWRYNTTIGCPEQYSGASLSKWRCGGGSWIPPGGAYVFNANTTSATTVNLGYIRIPGGAMGPYGCLRIAFAYTYTNSTNQKDFLGNISSTLGDTTGGYGFLNLNTIVSTNLSFFSNRLICNVQSQSIQNTVIPTNNAAGTGLSTTVVGGTVDTSGPFYVNLAGKVAAGDSNRLTTVAVEIITP